MSGVGGQRRWRALDISRVALLGAMLAGAGLAGAGLLGAVPVRADELPGGHVLTRDALARDGRRIATVRTSDGVAGASCWSAQIFEQRVGRWSLAAGHSPPRRLTGRCSPVVTTFAGSGGTLAVHEVWDGVISVLDVQDGRIAATAAIEIPGVKGHDFPAPAASLALTRDGRLLVAGAMNYDCALAVPQDACGVVHLFRRDAEGWRHDTRFPRPEGAGIAQRFGEAVALSGDSRTLLIGGTGFYGQPGNLFAYLAIGDDWELVQELRPSDRDDSAFGQDVAISDDGRLLAVGGDQRVHLFTRADDEWQLATVLPAPDERAGTFGGSVALSGDGMALLVGAPRSLCPVKEETRCGAAYRYALRRRGAEVSVEGGPERIEPPIPVALTDFGWRVALDGSGRLAAIQGALAHVLKQ